MTRNLIAYSGFLTMAAIATSRSLGCLLHRCKLDSAAKGRFQKFMLGKLMDFSLKWVDGVPLVH